MKLGKKRNFTNVILLNLFTDNLPTKTIMEKVNFSGVFLTAEEHGCLYTVCSEGELYYTPLYKDGSANLEEFDFVDFEESDADDKQLEEIQEVLCKMMQVAGLYFRPAVPV